MITDNITSAPTISVGIQANKTIEFKLTNHYYINNKKYSGTGLAKLHNGNISIALNGDTLVLSEILLTPESIDKCQAELKNVTIGVDFHWEQKENQVFQGALKLIIEDNKIQVINILPIENYLISVISSEMNANSSLNLLKAHAIISRSWLLAQIQKQDYISENKANYISTHHSTDEHIKWYDREDHKLFHVCADDHCQRYQGITRAQNPNVIKAVNETNGMVLTYDGDICDARFSKCCGGVSETFENCWEPIHHPYLSKVIDSENNDNKINLKNEQNSSAFINGNPESFCNTNDDKILSQVLNTYDHSAKDFYRWQVNYSQKQLSDLINKRSGINFGQIKELVPIERGESGRLVRLKIIGSKRSLVVGKELEIRKWLSESHLYSSAITITKEVSKDETKFSIRGAGWGHGVGLCQIGAAVMGEKGYDYTEILMHYYKNAEIKNLY